MPEEFLGDDGFAKEIEQPILGKVRQVNEYITSDGRVFTDKLEADQYSRGLEAARFSISVEKQIYGEGGWISERVQHLTNLINGDVEEDTPFKGSKEIAVQMWKDLGGLDKSDNSVSPGEKLRKLAAADPEGMYELVVKNITSWASDAADKSSKEEEDGGK